MSDAQLAIAHDLDSQRFTLVKDGMTAELNYRLGDGEMIITHIGVPRPLEGRGLGSALAKAGLEYAREAGLTVVPVCSFARAYIDRNPAYQSLLRRA